MPRSEAERRERLRRRNRWALFALLFPLIFTAVISIGLFFMWQRHMSLFKPSPSGWLPLAGAQV